MLVLAGCLSGLPTADPHWPSWRKLEPKIRHADGWTDQFVYEHLCQFVLQSASDEGSIFTNSYIFTRLSLCVLANRNIFGHIVEILAFSYLESRH
jgi:hypothetical protein